MAGWHLHYGRWWMVQWQWDWWISLGTHLDIRRRYNQRAGVWYGPYLDLHLGCVIVSLGWNPAYSGELDLVVNVGRGGIGG